MTSNNEFTELQHLWTDILQEGSILRSHSFARRDAQVGVQWGISLDTGTKDF